VTCVVCEVCRVLPAETGEMFKWLHQLRLYKPVSIIIIVILFQVSFH